MASTTSARSRRRRTWRARCRSRASSPIRIRGRRAAAGCSSASVQFCSALLHELRPLGEVGEHELTEFLGAASYWLRAVGDDALVHVGPLQYLHELVVELGDDSR